MQVAALILVSATAAFAQDLACEKCHAAESKSQALTAMARAATPASDAEILAKHPLLKVSNGVYLYVIAREGGRMKYSVSARGKTLAADLLWAFGAGSMGQTYLYEYRGALYESQVSFYSAIDGLDITIGHRNPAQFNLELAAGRRVDKLEQARCFGCHTTGSLPGVRCAHCHEDSKQHARSFSSGSRALVPAKLSVMSNDELSDFCGTCHRTWQDVQANGPHDINNVRLQPYRLATSKCYNSSIGDRRIGCLGCHDPHAPTETDSAYYDTKCRDCHGANAAPSAKVCKIAQQGCVVCHMPKVEFPGGHFKFTDHRIRIVRDSTYPS
jgi:hypothetical protein